jgi:hypothetical protein
MAPILAQAKWKQLIPGSLVNKYKLDLLGYALFPQTFAILQTR